MSSHSHHHHHHHRHHRQGREKANYHHNIHGTNGSQQEEFLVFGYSAKLHEPPEGEEADEGRGLIPWNGDETLKIDRKCLSVGEPDCNIGLEATVHPRSTAVLFAAVRLLTDSCLFSGIFVRPYDVRLYLNSLDEFDEHQVAQKKKHVAEDEEDDDEKTAEKLEEELCEEERYVDMYEDMQKREIEEAEKERERGKGAEIGFVYGEEDGEKKEMKTAEEEEEEDEPFEKPETLKLPVGIVTPDTNKQNALIERTAQFIIAKGPQMEVVIKAKQRQNAEQFGFLDFDHRLHPYYKYLCKLMREKKYTPQPPKPMKRKKMKSPTPSESDSGSDNEGYLHPLLMGSSASRAEASSPSPGFIGPSPRPIPQKMDKKPASPGPNLDALIQQFHRSANNENTLYSSLLKGLHSILPGTSSKEEEKGEKREPEGQQAENQQKQQQSDTTTRQQSGSGQGMLTFESDEQRISEYNAWHFDFYGRLSPYLPGPPPVPLVPAPDSAIESSITVASKYVALHGALAEQRLIEHNLDKVHFLSPRSPYYTFYQLRVRQYQWHLFQQSQLHQQSIQIQSAPIPPASLVRPTIAAPSAPSQLMSNPDLIPTKMPLDNISHGKEVPAEAGSEQTTNEPDSKQLERREKARLFMERILNERMAEKHRKAKMTEGGQEKERMGKKMEEPDQSSSSGPRGAENIPSAVVSPLELSKAISVLIDQQISQTLGTPSPKLPEEKGKKRRKDEEKTKREKRGKRHDHSSSSTSSSSDEDDQRKKRRRRRRRKSKSGSDEERRRRKKRYHRDDSSSPRRRHRRQRSRSDSSSNR